MANNCYRKSTLTALNTTAQTFVEAGLLEDSWRRRVVR